MPPQKVWSRDCATLQCMPFRFWVVFDPYPRQTKLQARTMPFPPTYYALALCVALNPTWLGFTLAASLARYRTAASSNTLSKGLEKIQAARGYDLAPIFVLSSDWEEKFLILSMAHSTVVALNTVRCLDHSGKLDESPQDKNKWLPQRCFATNCKSSSLPNQCLFELPEFWASQSLSHGTDCAPGETGLCWVSYASSAMVFVRPKDFTSREKYRCVELVAQMSLTLSHFNECPLLYNLTAASWRHASAL